MARLTVNQTLHGDHRKWMKGAVVYRCSWANVAPRRQFGRRAGVRTVRPGATCGV